MTGVRRPSTRGRGLTRSLTGTVGWHVFWGLVGVSCVALAVAGVVGIAAGGYQPERYVGSFDPVRAGMVVWAAAGTLAFALLGAAGFVLWRAHPEDIDLGGVVFFIGIAVAFVSVLAAVLWIPATPGPRGDPVGIRIGIYLAIGLMMAGFVPAVVNGVRDGVKRRDAGMLVAGVLFVAALIAIYFIRR